MDEGVRIAVVGMVAPAMVGLTAGAGTGLLARGAGAGASVGARVVAVVGVAVAVFVALFGVYGMPGWPLVSSVDRLFVLPPLLGVVGLAGVMITAWRGGKSAGVGSGLEWMVSSVAAGVGAGIGAAVALGPSFWKGSMQGMGGSAGVVWVPLVFGVWSAVSVWAVGRFMRGRADPARLAPSVTHSVRDTSPARAGEGAVVLVGLCAAVGAGLLGTGGKDLGLDGFACAAATAGLVIGLIVVRGSAGPGAIGVVCAMLGALLACGVFLSFTPWWVVGVLGCVAPAAVVADVVVGRKLGGVGGAIVRVGAAVVVAGIAVGPGIWSLVKFAMGEGGE